MIFTDACWRKPTPRPPVWVMRQAGRYLPEYREVRAKYGFLDMCHTPEAAAEVTLQPIRRFAMDAAIIFSDILLPLMPMGLHLRFAQGEGPVIDNPVRTQADVDALRHPDIESEMAYLADALRLTRAELPAETALIGFAGAPFTLACYAVQGHGGRFERIRQFMFGEPRVFDALLAKLAAVTVDHLRLQAAAGAQALQLFDSWGGLVSGYDYIHRIAPHVETVLEGTADLGVPRILFVKGANHFRDFLAHCPADVIGLDWTMPLAETRELLGPGYAVQGNLDPMVLFGSESLIRQRVLAMLEINGNQPGYIVNLGHGIHKDTPVAAMEILVDTVKNYRHR